MSLVKKYYLESNNEKKNCTRILRIRTKNINVYKRAYFCLELKIIKFSELGKRDF